MQAVSLPGGTMNRFRRTFVLVLVCQLSIASLAYAQSEPAKLWSLRAGIGFLEDPDAFLMNFEIERFMRDEVAVGLGMQLGVDDDYVVVSPMLFTRYVFDLSGSTNDVVKKLRPFAQAGVGITHIDVETRGRDADGTDFLLSLGAGIDYSLNDSLSIGSRTLINIIPGEVVKERIYFSWEIVSIRYHW
jgi:hypothetical protein